MAWRTFWFALWIALVCAIAGIVFVKYAKAADESAVYIVTVHVTISVFGVTMKPRMLPDNPKLRGAFALEADCKRLVPAARAEFEQYKAMVSDFKIVCEKVEIKR